MNKKQKDKKVNAQQRRWRKTQTWAQRIYEQEQGLETHERRRRRRIEDGSSPGRVGGEVRKEEDGGEAGGEEEEEEPGVWLPDVGLDHHSHP